MSDESPEREEVAPVLISALERIRNRSARVVVVGQGYVGLPLAIRASRVGFSVIGYEVDESRVRSLAMGRSHVGDISDAQLCEALNQGYVPTSDEEEVRNFDVAIVSVPTPLKDGLPDLRFIESAAHLVGRHVSEGCCVVLESTTYPGTTEELFAPILEQVSGLKRAQFFLGYSPERIDPANPKFTLQNTPKVISGDRPESLEVIDTFFSAIVDKTVSVGNCAEAELVKLLENTFRHVNIALINELAKFARGLDVNIWRAIDAAATKPFGFMKFTPGPGVGGHCLPIDPSYLAWRVKQELGHSFRFVELANDVNDHMPDYVLTRVIELLNRHDQCVNKSKILLLGFSYKANTGDWRESPSVRIAELLESMGSEVRICDPHVDFATTGKFARMAVEFDERSLRDHDLVVLLVDHTEFDARLIAENAQLIFDTRDSLRGLNFTGETL